MPIQLAMPSVYREENAYSRLSKEEDSNDFVYVSAEEKSGDLVMIRPDNRRQSVQVKVYRTSLEHFAVVYPQKKICNPLGVLNLKNTSCQRVGNDSQCALLLRQKGYDTTASLKFFCEYPREVESWISAFSNCASPFIRQSSLPIVEEDDEF